MGAALLGILGPLIPYVLLVFGIIGAYFGVKAKGKAEAKQTFDKQQAKATQKAVEAVAVATSKDQAIDQQAAKDKQSVEQTVNSSTPKPPDGPLVPGSEFKF